MDTISPQPLSAEKTAERREFHILIVDDDSAFRQSLHKLLAGLGFSVLTAKNGKEALELLKWHKVDLIFSDVLMPVMGGLEFLKQIKQRHPETHVVLVTAMSELTGEPEAMEMLASGYLRKPAKRHEILDMLKSFYCFDADETVKITEP
jgi:CheY-like chemotaxis protein